MFKILLALCLVSICLAESYNDLDVFDRALETLQEEKRKPQTPITIQEDRSYYISENNTHQKRNILIENDSILNIITAIESLITKGSENQKNKYYLEMIDLKNSDRIRYADFLYDNKLKSPENICLLYMDFMKILKLEQRKLHIILDTQTGNNRAFLSQHLENKRLEILIIHNIVLKYSR